MTLPVVGPASGTWLDLSCGGGARPSGLAA